MRYINTKCELSLAQGVPNKTSKFKAEISHQKKRNKNDLADTQTNKRVRSPNMKTNINMRSFYPPKRMQLDFI